MENEPPAKTPEPSPAQQKPTSSGSLFTVFKYVGIGMGIIGIGFIVAIGGFLLGQKNNAPQKTGATPTPIAAQTATPTSAPTATPSIQNTGLSNQKRYANPELGISFIFPTKSGDDPMDVKQVENKVFVYDTKYTYTQGQYVEVFQKSQQDSLTQAIQNQLLTNISQKDCFVKDAHPDQPANFPASYEVKTLGYPVDPNSDIPSFAQPNKCPTPYAESNGLSYFLGDTNHLKIFLFFSIGQQAFIIDNNTNKTWQDTIEFLN